MSKKDSGLRWLARKLTGTALTENTPSTAMFTYPPALTGLFASNIDAKVATLPLTSTNPQVMSFDIGIPQLQATGVSVGGVSASMPQMNGALQFLSQYIVWVQAGGQFTWQQDIVDAGGYNRNAILYDATLGRQLISLVDNNIAPFIPDGVNWRLYGASLSDVHAIGDYKYSEQLDNHKSGSGTWLICNGQSYSTLQYPALFALIGYRYGGSGNSFNVPNMIDRTMAMHSTAHAAATSAGANTYAVPVPSHYHGMTIYNNHTHSMIGYNAHTHSMIAYNQHSHGIAHGHYAWQEIHAHVVGAGAPVIQAGLISAGAYVNEVFISRVNSNTDDRQPKVFINDFNGQSSQVNSAPAGSVTDAVNNAGINTTDAVNYATSRSDDAGTAGATISSIQPTVYVQNVFIYAQ